MDDPKDPGFFLEQSQSANKNNAYGATRGNNNMIYAGLILIGILALIIIANKNKPEPELKSRPPPNTYIAYKLPPDRLNWVPKNVLNQELVIGNNRMEDKTGVPLLYQPHPFDVPIT